MIEDLHDYLPFFITDRIQDVLNRCASLPSLGLDPTRNTTPENIDVTLLDKPGGGVAYEFQRTALDLFETREVTGRGKNALDRAMANHERAVLHRFANSFAMAQLEKAKATLEKALEMHGDDANKYDEAREAHAAATARLVQELTRALLIVQRREEGRLGKDYQALLNEIIFLRKTYAIESRIRNDLDVCLCSMDLGGSNARQPKSELPAVFHSSLATSYLSDSYIDLPDLDLDLGDNGEKGDEGDGVVGQEDPLKQEGISGDGGDTIKAGEPVPEAEGSRT